MYPHLGWGQISSYYNYSIVEEADKRDITLYCLPSNTTHELQPFDKTVYRSFEHHWDEELLKFDHRNPDKKLNKSSFNVSLLQVWSKSMTHSNITNRVRATGLYSFDPHVIPQTAYASSTLTEIKSTQTIDGPQFSVGEI